jgi:hypothetical protein
LFGGSARFSGNPGFYNGVEVTLPRKECQCAVICEDIRLRERSSTNFQAFQFLPAAPPEHGKPGSGDVMPAVQVCNQSSAVTIFNHCFLFGVGASPLAVPSRGRMKISRTQLAWCQLGHLSDEKLNFAGLPLVNWQPLVVLDIN